LAELPQLVASSDIHAPTLIIIGEVVKLREKLNWYDNQIKLSD
jgi:uroporphyrin-III C-methyltransferase/precorrin-2 dehydrogenase/sirohydrochlorin ferrochelatase